MPPSRRLPPGVAEGAADPGTRRDGEGAPRSRGPRGNASRPPAGTPAGEWQETRTSLSGSTSRASSPWRTARRLAPFCALALLVAGSSAFVARQAAERWGISDPVLQPGPAGGQRWFEDRVVVTLDESLDGLGPEAKAALAAAFHAWQETGAPLPEVSFSRGRGARPSLTPDGVNAVMVAPIDFEGHETDLAITIGFSHPKTGEITEADIVINSRHVFSVMAERDRLAASDAAESGNAAAPALRPLSCLGTSDGASCGQTYDLQNVLTHEVGHFWGLPEDFEDRSSTMYSCTSACEVHKRRLTAEDADALVRLYGASTAQGCSGAQFARGAASASSRATALALALGLGGLWWGKRRRRRTPVR